MLELYRSNTNSYELLTGKSLAMFLFRDDKYVYLLRGTTVSPYMSEQLYKDIKEAMELGFTLSEIVELFDKSDSLELLGTTLETFEKDGTFNYQTLKERIKSLLFFIFNEERRELLWP